MIVPGCVLYVACIDRWLAAVVGVVFIYMPMSILFIVLVIGRFCVVVAFYAVSNAIPKTDKKRRVFYYDRYEMSDGR